MQRMLLLHCVISPWLTICFLGFLCCFFSYSLRWVLSPFISALLPFYLCIQGYVVLPTHSFDCNPQVLTCSISTDFQLGNVYYLTDEDFSDMYIRLHLFIHGIYFYYFFVCLFYQLLTEKMLRFSHKYCGFCFI